MEVRALYSFTLVIPMYRTSSHLFLSHFRSAVAAPFLPILHHLCGFSHQCCLSSHHPSSVPSLSSSSSFLNLTPHTLLTIQLNVHCFCPMLFHIMAYCACSTPPPLSVSPGLYLPVRRLSVVFGNCVKQIEQVQIGKDLCLFLIQAFRLTI